MISVGRVAGGLESGSPRRVIGGAALPRVVVRPHKREYVNLLHIA
jgi:hypothetical protein